MLIRSCYNFRLTLKQHPIRLVLQAKFLATMNKAPPKQSTTKLAQRAPLASMPTAHFEVLPSPVKSHSDKKEYRVIKLQNGLTACLICDTKPCTSESTASRHSSDSESASEEEASGDDADSVQSYEVQEVEEDDRSMRAKLKNKSHDEVKLAAAALCIGVGSFSDPKEVPGLAHFLEHMVFMGSEKYPQENDFDSFIKKHGGSDNASTDYETTTFYFECFEKHLYQALDKFAQFFISPLMKRESMTREREAIESEFQMATPSDDYRKEQLLVSFADKQSPVNSFSWGNLITLKDNVTDDRLYEMLHEFRKRHYSAHRMTLAVQARLPLDVLESYIVELFSQIPHINLPPLDFSPFTELVFQTPQFRKLYYVKPVKDICQVDLTWIMPSLQGFYKSKPHVYVSWLLGHEGKGSLLSYLKKKIWALSLYAGNGESGAEFNSIYASFSVNIVLTKQGFAHLEEVIEAVFSYIKMLQTVGPSERIFKEIQSIEEISFRFEEDESASDKVEDLSECMQFYPPEDYLTGSELFFNYNPQAITMVLDYLVPQKMNVLVLSTEVPVGIVYDQIEPWFKTYYTTRDVPEEWIKKWQNPQTNPNFKLPAPNPFLTSDFSLLAAVDNIPDYPEKILNTPMVELWYRKDQKFGLPMAYYYYYFMTPFSTESAHSACMLQMFVVFVNILLAEEGYPAQIAELEYSVAACEKGISLKITGYNQKLPSLIDLVALYLTTTCTRLTEDLFDAVKEKQTKNFYNGFLKPSKLSKDMRLAILQNSYFSLLDRHAAIQDITYSMMKTFCGKIMKELYIQGLVQGNITSDTALETTKSLIKKLNCSFLPPQAHPKIVINEIPTGEHCCRALSFNLDNTNSVITNYYQCGVLDIKDNVILEFLMLQIEEPLFDILRTKEQLGYSVFCSIRDTYGILGYTITVNAQADKHKAEFVDKRIEAFLKYTNKMLKRMSDKKFKQKKRDLIKMKQVVDVDLEDEVDRNWDEIISKKYIFDRLTKEIDAIEDLRIGEVRKWWEEHNIHGKGQNYKKLSVQVIGHTSVKAATPDNKEVEKTLTASSAIKTDYPKEFKLNLLNNELEDSSDEKKSENYFILNIDHFKKQLNTYVDVILRS